MKRVYDKSFIIVSVVIFCLFRNKTDSPRKFDDTRDSIIFQTGRGNAIIAHDIRLRACCNSSVIQATIKTMLSCVRKRVYNLATRRGAAGLPLRNSSSFFAVNRSRNLSKLVFGAGTLANNVTVTMPETGVGRYNFRAARMNRPFLCFWKRGSICFKFLFSTFQLFQIQNNFFKSLY